MMGSYVVRVVGDSGKSSGTISATEPCNYTLELENNWTRKAQR